MRKILSCPYYLLKISSVLEVNGIMHHGESDNCKAECIVTPFALHETFPVNAAMRPFFSRDRFAGLYYSIAILCGKVLV